MTSTLPTEACRLVVGTLPSPSPSSLPRRTGALLGQGNFPRGAYLRHPSRRALSMGSQAASEPLGFDFTGQRVVVIAGSAGIGLAAAKLFAHLGAEVIIASSNAERLDGAVRAVGHNAVGIQTDATEDEQIKALFEKVGTFDHLIASSGRKKDAPFLQATPEELFSPWRQKYWTYAKAARYGAHKIKPGGSITFIGGGNGTKPGPGNHQAAAVNAATEGLARALTVELSPTRVNVVSPGVVETELWLSLVPDPDARAETLKKQAAQLPSKRLGTPEEIARVIVSIASSPFTNGSVFHVNGGKFLS